MRAAAAGYPLLAALHSGCSRQSSSQVPSIVTLKLLRRCLSNSSSDSFSQAYFRRGIGIQKLQKRCLNGVIGYRRQQPQSVRGVPLFGVRGGFGSKAARTAPKRHFRFPPGSGHGLPLPRAAAYGNLRLGWGDLHELGL